MVNKTETDKPESVNQSRPMPELLLEENEHLNENSGSDQDDALNLPDNRVKSIFSAQATSNILNDLMEA